MFVAVSQSPQSLLSYLHSVKKINNLLYNKFCMTLLKLAVLGLWCLMPLSPIFQLLVYCGGQFFKPFLVLQSRNYEITNALYCSLMSTPVGLSTK
jgi:hypothetical protein